MKTDKFLLLALGALLIIRFDVVGSTSGYSGSGLDLSLNTVNGGISVKSA